MRRHTLSVVLLLAVVTAVWAVPAEEQTIRIAEKVQKGVVTLEVFPKKVIKKKVRVWPEEEGPWEEYKEFPWGEWFKEFQKRFRIEIPGFQGPMYGTGFVFQKTDDGYYVVTAAHVVADAKEIEVTLPDGTLLNDDAVEVVGVDRPTDVAVLKIRTDVPLAVLPVGDSDELRVGQWVLAVGTPFGYARSVSFGIVSALHRSGVRIPGGPEYQDFIQTDAAVNPGNSGGPLVNMKGEVIGMVTAMSSRSGGSSGVGFAIPANTVRWVAESLIREGRVVRGYLGVYIQDMTPDLAEGLGLKEARGVLVTEVIAGSPADEAGLEDGDVILEVNGQKVWNSGDLRLRIAQIQPGKTARIVIFRDGKKKTVTVTLGERPESEAAVSRKARNWGMTLQEEEGKVYVEDVVPGSPADEAGIEEGDELLKIGTVKIRGLDDVQRAIEKYQDSQRPVLVIVRRDERKRFLTLRP